MGASTSLRVLRAADGLAIGEVGAVCVVVWREAVVRARFEAQRAALDEVAARHPGGVGFLCVIEPTAKPPDDELRRASAEMVKRHRGVLRCVGCAVEGTGFANAVGRSVLSAMALLIGPRLVPLGIHGTATQAVAWMAPRLDLGDPAALVQAVETLRAKLPPAASA